MWIGRNGVLALACAYDTGSLLMIFLVSAAAIEVFVALVSLAFTLAHWVAFLYNWIV
jgi:hypothetical protein